MAQNDFSPACRIGHGFDLHRLDAVAPAGQGRPLVLGCVRIESDRGPVAHSDGDALAHAITDAILGALGEPDIGELFPDSSPKWKDADSTIFLREAVGRARAAGYEVGNVDAVVVLQHPRLSPHKDAIRSRLAALLGVPGGRVNVKGKSHEGVDAIGEGRAVAAHASVLLIRRGVES